MKYPKHSEGSNGWTEWVQPEPSGYRMRCCDCNLVHEMQFRICDGEVQFRARRHNRATGQSRRQIPGMGE
jgi:hypothetical protein